jgi:hypothetical protein
MRSSLNHTEYTPDLLIILPLSSVCYCKVMALTLPYWSCIIILWQCKALILRKPVAFIIFDFDHDTVQMCWLFLHHKYWYITIHKYLSSVFQSSFSKHFHMEMTWKLVVMETIWVSPQKTIIQKKCYRFKPLSNILSIVWHFTFPK